MSSTARIRCSHAVISRPKERNHCQNRHRKRRRRGAAKLVYRMTIYPTFCEFLGLRSPSRTRRKLGTQECRTSFCEVKTAGKT